MLWHLEMRNRGRQLVRCSRRSAQCPATRRWYRSDRFRRKQFASPAVAFLFHHLKSRTLSCLAKTHCERSFGRLPMETFQKSTASWYPSLIRLGYNLLEQLIRLLIVGENRSCSSCEPLQTLLDRLQVVVDPSTSAVCCQDGRHRKLGHNFEHTSFQHASKGVQLEFSSETSKKMVDVVSWI